MHPLFNGRDRSIILELDLDSVFVRHNKSRDTANSRLLEYVHLLCQDTHLARSFANLVPVLCELNAIGAGRRVIVSQGPICVSVQELVDLGLAVEIGPNHNRADYKDQNE